MVGYKIITNFHYDTIERSELYKLFCFYKNSSTKSYLITFKSFPSSYSSQIKN